MVTTKKIGKLKIALFSFDVIWEHPSENLVIFETIISDFYKCLSSSELPDILIFPEMFSSGFSLRVHSAEGMNGLSYGWCKNIAIKYNTAVVTSIAIKENDMLFNRCFFIRPDVISGEDVYYDKRHLFRMAGEDENFTAGCRKVITTYKGWNICLNVCYDLRFPVWSRNVNREYDLLINVANWPKRRENVLNPLLRARAIENQAYVAFCNRAGFDPNAEYVGESEVFDFNGNSIRSTYNINGVNVSVSVLSSSELYKYRNKFPVWMDEDSFTVVK